MLNWSIALLAKTSHSIYEVISQVMQLPALSYVLRKTKEIVGAQNIVKDRGLNLCNVKTILGNLIGSNKSRVKKIKGALGFDDMYIKQGINWDLNQTKIVGVDPQLSYDVISNEF